MFSFVAMIPWEVIPLASSKIDTSIKKKGSYVDD